MKNNDAIVLNYLRNLPEAKNKPAKDLEILMRDRIPYPISGIWYHLLLDDLESIDWDALSEFLSNEDYYEAIKAEQRIH